MGSQCRRAFWPISCYIVSPTHVHWHVLHILGCNKKATTLCLPLTLLHTQAGIAKHAEVWRHHVPAQHAMAQHMDDKASRCQGMRSGEGVTCQPNILRRAGSTTRLKVTMLLTGLPGRPKTSIRLHGTHLHLSHQGRGGARGAQLQRCCSFKCRRHETGREWYGAGDIK